MKFVFWILNCFIFYYVVCIIHTKRNFRMSTKSNTSTFHPALQFSFVRKNGLFNWAPWHSLGFLSLSLRLTLQHGRFPSVVISVWCFDFFIKKILLSISIESDKLYYTILVKGWVAIHFYCFWIIISCILHRHHFFFCCCCYAILCCILLVCYFLF